MNILLLAFAIPVATILLAIVLQKVLKCPLLVAATFFAVLLIITFAVFDSSFLVFAIIYTILAYITAVLTRFICNLISRFGLRDNCLCDNTRNSDNNCSRNENCNISSGTWRYTTRNVPRIGTNQVSTTNALSNNGSDCASNNNLNEENESVIVLTNDNNVNGNDSGRSGRNYCHCNGNRR